MEPDTDVSTDVSTDFDSLSTAGRVDYHVERSRANGALTIRDHLIADGIHDIPVLNALYREIYNGLKEDGQFHEHLGPVYLLAQRRGGRQPEGFGDDPPRGFDKRKPDPNRAVLVQDYRALADQPHHFSNTSAAIRVGAIATAGVQSRRRQEQIVGGPVAQAQEIDFMRQRIDHLEDKVLFLERENEMLRTGRVILTDGRGVRPRPATLPASGNGGPH